MQRLQEQAGVIDHPLANAALRFLIVHLASPRAWADS
jgi:hypothetical protein